MIRIIIIATQALWIQYLFGFVTISVTPRSDWAKASARMIETITMRYSNIVTLRSGILSQDLPRFYS